jgi:ribosome-binding protein aMBF1 (putative translation factor)
MDAPSDEYPLPVDHDIGSRIVRAIGEKLRRVRSNLGWSRPELVKRMNSSVPVN